MREAIDVPVASPDSWVDFLAQLLWSCPQPCLLLLLTGLLEQSQDGLQIWFCTLSCKCLSADPVTTILLSPFTSNSVGLKDYALTVEGNASAEVILGSQAVVPCGADQCLLFPGSLCCMDNTYAKISDVTIPLNVPMLQVKPCYLLPQCPDATEKWNCRQDWLEHKPGDVL